jgi:hypothetical protein
VPLGRDSLAAGVTAEQRAELGRAAEGIGDLFARRERDGRVDPSVALGEQMRPGREGPGVELGEPLQRGEVGGEREAKRERPLPGREPVSHLLASVPPWFFHESDYAGRSDLCKMLLSQDRS